MSFDFLSQGIQTVCNFDDILKSVHFQRQEAKKGMDDTGALWRMNSRGGQKEKFSRKIYLIYLYQIEVFHVSVRGEEGGAEKLITFALAGKIFKMHFYLSSSRCLCFFVLTVNVPDIRLRRHHGYHQRGKFYII